MSLEVYGIPNCGTCKKALQWLQTNNIEHVFINTKEKPPSLEMIQNWVTTLGSQPMRNTSGQSYRALGAEKKAWNNQQWVEAFVKDAMLLKRPLFVKNGIAVMVGFKEGEIHTKLGI
ncbi:Spx/MgsR family RNA polymerase-binding regulatory protein [Calothrix sp. UHCC 0171]|uniref:Spx/MgsR family RNA polymerase-binding regulatory protein n=1 Tax=Calothrix sp. UHCC 0171 TaxID=3110245 RepID=UPI002B21FDAB|nr:Spx/MgsR family RNA polymerase-binding regulatory protein [Calothrix sp. UHCC 0171]MEA5572311.1 Spx/MgsR family RNA polymerase-binding regulatory protein [Calothrix sp. UHCC 0171]